MRWSAVGFRVACLVVLLSSAQARAEVAMNGTFTGTQACPALGSIRKGTNPGNIQVEANKAYDVIAKNKANATYYRILVAGAQPQERWVAASCGQVAANEGPAKPGATAGPKSTGGVAAGDASGARATHVLAMGWEPAFCAKHSDKSECRVLAAGSFPATHLSLHGLWPQPRGTQYCGVAADVSQLDRAHNWDALPEPDMSAATLKRLAAVMPGVQSKLQRHEWIVHGTCFGGSADGYFARAAGLAEAVDTSKVSKLFADRVGKNLSTDAIRAAFDQAFGAGAGLRVAVSCNGRGGSRRITELTINLAGDVTGSAGLGDLMRSAQTVSPGCPGGLVDSARSRRGWLRRMFGG